MSTPAVIICHWGTQHIDEEIRWDSTCWDIIGSSVLCLQSSWKSNPFVSYLRNETWANERRVFVELGQAIALASFGVRIAKGEGENVGLPALIASAKPKDISQVTYLRVLQNENITGSESFLTWKVKLSELPVSFWCGFDLKNAFKIFYSFSLVANWEFIFQTLILTIGR